VIRDVKTGRRGAHSQKVTFTLDFLAVKGLRIDLRSSSSLKIKLNCNYIILDAVAVVESVKAASDVLSPVTGTITAVNDKLTGSPAKINGAAESDGTSVIYIYIYI